MRPVRFGLFFPQVGLPFSVLRDRARLAERLGYDSILFVDHMWGKGLPDADHLEAWTLMTAVTAATERLRVGSLVLCNSYRNPALLAKMASSLDAIGNGRLILGLGAGWMEEEYRAYGYPFPRARARIEQLDEALEVVKRLLSEPRATFQGKYYAVDDAVNLPKPAPTRRPPILIGGAGERRLLRVVARHADIWNCPNNHAAELPRKLDLLREHCAAIGRDFDEIEVSEQCVIVVGRDEKDFEQKWRAARATLGRVWEIEKAGFRGTPEQIVEQIRTRNEQGVTFFTFLLGDNHAPESLELLAERVLPAFR